MNEEQEDKNILNSEAINPAQRVGQEQIHDLLFGDKLSWQAIIYDLINTEQLDPWDIDLSLLAQKYLVRVRELEEANFFVSSKVLLAASLLLRMKSEILLDHDLPGLDAILFGKKEEKKYVQERIELDEEIPGLVVRTPLPRYKKITLEELMKALGQAIKTENRRIKRIVLTKQQEFETSIAIPKNRINLQDKIKEIYAKIEEVFSKREDRLAFSELAGEKSEERVSTFVPLLHLDNQQKVWLEQEEHLDEIWILLKHLYEKQNADLLEAMKKEAAEEMAKMMEEEKIMKDIKKAKDGDEEGEEDEEGPARARKKSKNIEEVDLDEE
ncbi:MAG: segregation/condensation protein A [Nanoarchaeota archaeon]|nr:segregation/condensation protein A [Nanoarchaeota archaeon]